MEIFRVSWRFVVCKFLFKDNLTAHFTRFGPGLGSLYGSKEIKLFFGCVEELELDMFLWKVKLCVHFSSYWSFSLRSFSFII